MVWKIDRFGRCQQELIELMSVLKKRGVGFVSLRESLDTTTLGGKLVCHVFGAVANLERALVLEASKARGSHGGRPRALNEGRQS